MRILQEGQKLKDAYEVERFLGEGAFAEVYRVRHKFLGRQAMKVMKATMTLGEVEMMLGEAILLSQIGHPNIVRVFNADVVDTAAGMRGFYTMEYIAAGSLEDYWRSFGRSYVPVESAVELICHACRGLAVAHRLDPPVVHRDIKPQNILVGYDDGGLLRARVSDFGLAKRVNPMTLLLSGKGTLRFKPPEVIRDYKSDSCAGDVWALGCTLYMLLTDRLPYAETEGVDPYDSGRFDSPLIPPSRLNIAVDETLDQIVIKALSPCISGPGARYSDAQLMLKDLERWKPGKGQVHDSSVSSTSEKSKAVLGTASPADEATGRKMASEAVQMARDPAKLGTAADLLEQAFNKCPKLRERYAYRLGLWRRGVIG